MSEVKGGREGGKEGEREGGRERGREGGERERGRERGREGEREKTRVLTGADNACILKMLTVVYAEAAVLALQQGALCARTRHIIQVDGAWRGGVWARLATEHCPAGPTAQAQAHCPSTGPLPKHRPTHSPVPLG